MPKNLDFINTYGTAFRSVQRSYPLFRKHFFGVSVVFLVAALLSGSAPYLMRTTINEIAAIDSDYHLAMLSVVAYGVCWTVALVLQNIKGIFSAYVLARSDASLIGNCYSTVFAQTHSANLRIAPGELAQDIDRSSQAFSAITTAIFWSLTPITVEFVLAVAFIAFSISASFAALFGGGLIALSIIAVLVAFKTKDVHTAMFVAENDVRRFCIERLAGASEVKFNQAADVDRKSLDLLLDKQVSAIWRANKIMGVYLGGQALAIGFFLLVCTALAVEMRGRQLITPGDFTLIAGYIGGLAAQLHLFAGAVIEVRRNHLALGRTEHLMSNNATDRLSKTTLPKRLDTEVVFAVSDLCLTAGDRHLIEPFSGNFYRNKLTAITGPSGVGKSTLLLSMLGLLSVRSGCVRIAGYDVRNLPEGAVLDLVSYVPQTPVIFSGTLRENLLYGLAEPASDSEVRSVLEGLGLFDGAEDELTPFDLDLVLGVGVGRALSGGEAKRLAIGRALLRGKPIVLLDEPTSGLDSKSSNETIKYLRSQVDTLIVVTHDDLVLASADTVFELSGITDPSNACN